MRERRRKVIVAGLVVVGALAVIAVAVKLRQQQQVADQASEAILHQLEEMDPVTRVMVEKRLATHAAHTIEDALRHS